MTPPTKASLDDVRRFYAAFVTATGGTDDPRIHDAFLAVRREDFLPAGPWRIFTSSGYIETPSADPVHLYQDILVALDAEAGINNGQPSLHARCLDAVAPKTGERVLHIGCGGGYYTAILAHLVGADGRVEGIEISAELARAAARNLSGFANVRVARRSGSEGALPKSDVVYVSAGASAPPVIWFRALAPGGRLIFPLTAGNGAMLLVTRIADANALAARLVCRAGFIPCIGAQSEPAAEALKAAYESRDWREVRSLRLGAPPGDEEPWFAGQGWWLSSAPPGE